MGSGKEKKVICPECGQALLKRAKMGVGRTPFDDRLYHCPACKEVYLGEELRVRWKAHQRPDLEVVR